MEWLQNLDQTASSLGPWLLLLLFGFGFFQTGLVIGPIIPGNTLLFAFGVLASGDAAKLNPWLGGFCLALGGFLGCLANYGQGQVLGGKIFSRDRGLLSRDRLDQTHAFLEKHGRTAMAVAPFTPFIRSFAGFVAGMGRMDFAPFVLFSLFGCTAWIGLFFGAGAIFGQIPAVRQNLGAAVLAIVAFVTLAVIVKAVRPASRKSPEPTPQTPAPPDPPRHH